MKYVVTGGAGFIGSNLVDKLVSQNHEVHVIDNFISGKKENCNRKAQYHKVDISDIDNFSKIKKILFDVDTVFHLAALARVQPSILNPVKYELNNSIGIVNMLKSSEEMNVRRFVYSSSSSVYGPTEKLPSLESDLPNPISPYANQKYYGELCCKMFHQLYGIETVSLRYFNVFGERQNIGGAYATVIGIFIDQFKNGKSLTINGDGNQKRDFTYVGDVVTANILSSTSKKVGKGDILNIGSGKNITINTIANLIGSKTIHVDPVNEPHANLANISKAKDLLGWEPSVKVEDWLKDLKIN
tara:strand:- start:6563 stop:7462 length:900 start_codon:yes stop_codon:yes gene_type:complete